MTALAVAPVSPAAPSLDARQQTEAVTAPRDPTDRGRWVSGAQRLTASEHHAEILDRIEIATRLREAPHGLWVPLHGAPLVTTSDRLRREDSFGNEALRLIRSAIPPPPTRPAATTKHKTLQLTAKQKSIVRAQQVRSASTEERLRLCERFRLQRQWTAAVDAIHRTTFDAIGVTNDSQRRERRQRLQVPFSLVRRADRDLVVEGALFYLCIGDFIRHGQTIPGSLVWFRRGLLDLRSPAELVAAADARLALINWSS